MGRRASQKKERAELKKVNKFLDKKASDPLIINQLKRVSIAIWRGID